MVPPFSKTKFGTIYEFFVTLHNVVHFFSIVNLIIRILSLLKLMLRFVQIPYLLDLYQDIIQKEFILNAEANKTIV
ncbi:hypothetical protein AK95_25680 [Paenibacillus sp. LC231]|nr:hypothetical protein AK95_25680 [Paenibacillus sp. LC231]